MKGTALGGMKSRALLGTVLLVSMLTPATWAQSSRPPNIVVIFA